MRHRHTTITQAQIPPAFHRPARPRAQTQIIAVAAAVLLALTGCTGTDAEADPTRIPPASIPATTVAPTTEASTPTAPPTAEPTYQPATENGPAQNVPVPVLPEKAKEFSREGLIAFAEYWYSTLGYAFETGDPEPMMAISGPDCRNCGAMKEIVIAGHTDGRWIMGGRMILSTPSATFNQMPDGTYQAIVMARQEQVKYFRASKELSKDLGVTKAEGDILVGIYVDGHWTAKTVEHLAGSKAS